MYKSCSLNKPVLNLSGVSRSAVCHCTGGNSIKEIPVVEPLSGNRLMASDLANVKIISKNYLSHSPPKEK